MRWLWIDRVVELEPGRRLVAIKNVTLAEEHLAQTGADDSGVGGPVMPASLIIEGCAQAGGILVGHAADFAEKVVLAKISKAELHADVGPGTTLRYEAVAQTFSPAGASVAIAVRARDAASDGPWVDVGAVELMFSYLDRSGSSEEYPKENFVFGANFRVLLDGVPPASRAGAP